MGFYELPDTMNRSFKLAEQLSVTEVDDEVVLLKLDTGSYFGLNSVGTKFVKGLQDDKTLHQICAEISGSYQIPYQNVNQDLGELIDQLLDEQLIVEVDDS